MGTLDTIDTSSAETENLYYWDHPLPDRADINSLDLGWLKGCKFASRFIRSYNKGNVEQGNYYKYLNVWMLLYWNYNKMGQQKLDWLSSKELYQKPLKKQLFRPESNTSETEDLCELVLDVLGTKKLTWKKASEIALLALHRAEERRNIFVEEEANITASWEESD